MITLSHVLRLGLGVTSLYSAGSIARDVPKIRSVQNQVSGRISDITEDVCVLGVTGQSFSGDLDPKRGLFVANSSRVLKAISHALSGGEGDPRVYIVTFASGTKFNTLRYDYNFISEGVGSKALVLKDLSTDDIHLVQDFSTFVTPEGISRISLNTPTPVPEFSLATRFLLQGLRFFV